MNAHHMYEKPKAVIDENLLKPSGPGTHLRQSRRACFHNIISPIPAIVCVTSGTKRVSGACAKRDIPCGSLTLLPEHQPITVENIPHGNKPYEAQVLTIERRIFEAAYERLIVSEEARQQTFQSVMVKDQIEEAFLSARLALAQRHTLPDGIVQNRCEELILWLADSGVFLPWPTAISFADRIRSLVAADPGRRWTSADAGHALSLSEASLRRKLRAEGNSFKVILLEIRMLIALSLLQTTNHKVATIAEQVGYQSQSRFSHRFKQRFGLNPSLLRQPVSTTPIHSRSLTKEPQS